MSDETKTTNWSGMPPDPDQQGWHLLAEWDDQMNIPASEFVLWWNADASMWTDRRGAPLSEHDTTEKTAEFYRYVCPMKELANAN